MATRPGDVLGEGGIVQRGFNEAPIKSAKAHEHIAYQISQTPCDTMLARLEQDKPHPTVNVNPMIGTYPPLPSTLPPPQATLSGAQTLKADSLVIGLEGFARGTRVSAQLHA